MNKNLVQILSILIQKLLKDEDLWSNQDEIIIDLEDQGYTVEDISEAFEIIFTKVIDLEEKDFYIDTDMTSGYNRVFTDVEKFYFDNETKSIIYKLNKLGILKADTLEIIIHRLIKIAVLNDLEADLIWEVIDDEIDNEKTIVKIAAEIEEFEDNFLKQEIVN